MMSASATQGGHKKAKAQENKAANHNKQNRYFHF